MTPPSGSLPLVYSCSGCSNAAQAANTLAVRLDRKRLADMSCIVGVAAGVPSLVRIAESGRPMIVIDGCGIRCAARALANHGIKPDAAIDLSGHQVRKRLHEDLPPEDLGRLWEEVILPALAQVEDRG